MKKIIILGASNPTIIGVIDDINKQGMENYEILGFLDNNVSLKGATFHNYRIFGGVEEAARFATDDIHFVNTIASSSDVRRQTSLDLEKFCDRLATLIHPSVINHASQVGPGTIVYPGAVLQSEVKIGSHCIISSLSGVAHETTIDFVFIGPNSYVSGRVNIESASFVGVGATILPDLQIGKNAVVGAGSLINKDVAPSTKVFGVPGRVIT